MTNNIINLSTDLKDHQAKIREFFKKANDDFYPTLFYEKFTNKLSHDLLYCRELNAFLVLDEAFIGDGSVGKVKKNIGLIKVNNNQIIFQKDENYVVKIIDDIDIECANENEISKKISYLGMKNLVTVNITQYQIMNRINGINMREFLASEAFKQMFDLAPKKRTLN